MRQEPSFLKPAFLTIFTDLVQGVTIDFSFLGFPVFLGFPIET